MIAQYLIDNFEDKIKIFFPNNDPKGEWKSKFKKNLKSINHDEPWLTLIACYSLFGDQNDYNENRFLAINKAFKKSGLNDKIKFNSIEEVTIEERLPEIIDYRAEVKKANKSGSFHLYPDISEIIRGKVDKENSSFEGSTNLDLMIRGESNGKPSICFIEAKFLSDISYQTTYNPSRDQIIRNIDCGIDLVLNDEKQVNNFNDFYFLLLTPKVFRTDKFGGSKNSELAKFGANSSRLYCYKMNEYKDYEILKSSLPHRKLTDEQWKTIAGNVGWMTFEDIYNISNEYSLIADKNESKMIGEFFEERNLI